MPTLIRTRLIIDHRYLWAGRACANRLRKKKHLITVKHSQWRRNELLPMGVDE